MVRAMLLRAAFGGMEGDIAMLHRAAATWQRLGGVNVYLVGMMGAGKSSVLNAIIGVKKLSVSRTAGHTKHIQHIYIPQSEGAEEDGAPKIRVMDCPGLVFPNYTATRHVMELSGVLPTAQVRETCS